VISTIVSSHATTSHRDLIANIRTRIRRDFKQKLDLFIECPSMRMIKGASSEHPLLKIGIKDFLCKLIKLGKLIKWNSKGNRWNWKGNGLTDKRRNFGCQ